VTKNEIADVLNEIAVLLDLKGENPFKIRAYQSGARVLESLEEDLGKNHRRRPARIDQGHRRGVWLRK